MVSIIDSKETEKIVLEHLLRVRQLEDETCLVLRDRVENLITRLLLKMNQNLKGYDNIKCYDSLYYKTEELKDCYEGFLEALDSHPVMIVDDKIRDIFLTLRAMIVDFLDSVPSKTDNPITYERMVLISATILRNKQYWINRLEDAFIECTIGNDVSKEILMSYMSKKVREFFFDGMFTAVQLLEDNLRIMSEFEEGRRYEKKLQEQVRQLELLAMLQRDVILSQAASSEESGFLESLLDALANGYRMISKALSNLEEQPDLKVDAHEILHMEQVDELLDSYIFNDAEKIRGLLQMAGEIKEESIEALKRIVETQVNYRSNEIRKKIDREASGYQLLSGQLAELFLDSVKELESLPESCRTGGGKAVAEGIAATMVLKLDAVREKDWAYQMGKKNIAKELEQQVLDQERIFIEQTEQILEDLLDGSDAVLSRITKSFLDSVESIIQQHNRYDLSYLKNDLLFELRTFDELIEHSLKKLIDHEQDNARAVMAVMLGTMEKSRDILKAHAIELIIPHEHDKFDIKKHEVLLAEEAEGFVKGEVICCMSVGYQMKAQVIIRASVMAAR